MMKIIFIYIRGITTCYNHKLHTVQYKVSTYSAAFLINVELFFVVFIYFVELIDGYSSLSSAAGIRG